MRKRQWMVLALAALGIGAMAFAVVRSSQFRKWYDPPALVLPANDEVAEVRASLREFQGAFPEVPEFTVPGDRVPAVLGWLRPAEKVNDPWTLYPHDEIGEVVIRTKAGGEFRLRFYWTGKNSAVFTPDGRTQFYGRGSDEQGRWVDGGMCLRYAIEGASKVTPRQ